MQHVAVHNRVGREGYSIPDGYSQILALTMHPSFGMPTLYMANQGFPMFCFMGLNITPVMSNCVGSPIFPDLSCLCRVATELEFYYRIISRPAQCSMGRVTGHSILNLGYWDWDWILGWVRVQDSEYFR